MIVAALVGQPSTIEYALLHLFEGNQWFSRCNLKDVAINIIGFIPLELFFSAWLWHFKNFPAPQVYGISLLISTCLSLAIEVIQAYFPTRYSSLADVFSNTLGTALGVFIFKYALPIFHKSKGMSASIVADPLGNRIFYRKKAQMS